MKILIVIPPSPYLIDDRVFPFLGPLQIAAVAREQLGAEVEVLDLTGHARRCSEPRHRESCMRSEIARARTEVVFAAAGADLIGMYALVAQYPVVKQCAQALRDSGYEGKLVLGGPHANTVGTPGYESACKNVLADGWDWVVQADQGGGGGEPGFVYLLNCLYDNEPPPLGVIRVPSRSGLKYPNDRWPYPARDLIDLESYHYEIAGERATSMLTQAGCPYACVSGDTLLATPERIFRPEEELLGQPFQCTGHMHRRGEQLAALVEQGDRECLGLRLSNGLQLDLTPDHPVLAVVGGQPSYVVAGDLSVGDWAICEIGQNAVARPVPLSPVPLSTYANGKPRARQVRTPAVFDERTAWLTGYLIGNGCIPLDGRSSLHFALSVRAKAEVVATVQACFGVAVRVTPSTQTEKMWHGWVHSRAVVDFFTKAVGVDPRDKLRVPKAVLQSPAGVVRAFLDGLWAADAYWARGKLPTLSTVSERLARECAALIHWIGDGAVIRTYDTRDYTDASYTVQPHWRVEWHAAATMHRRVGHPWVGSRVPLAHRYYKSSKSGRWHRRTKWNRHGVSRAVLEDAEPDHVLNNDRWIYARVVAKKKIGTRRTFDLLDQPGHKFVANGVAVHNCSFCSHFPGYRQLVIRSIPHVIGELRAIKGAYGIRAVMFYDDEINMRSDFEEYLEALKAEDVIWRGFFKSGRKYMRDDLFAKMRASGCVQLCTGAESFDPEVLRRVGKGSTVEDNLTFVRLCWKHGITPKVFLQVGLPGETHESVRNTRQAALRLTREGQVDFDFTVTVPYYGTPIWEQPEKFPDFIYDKKTLDFGGESPVFYKQQPGVYQVFSRTAELSGQEIVRLRDELEHDVREAAGQEPLLPEEAEAGTKVEVARGAV